MTGLTILDRTSDGTVAVSLEILFGLLNEYVRGMRWVASEVEALGLGAGELHDAAERREFLTSEQLLRLEPFPERVKNLR